MTVQEASIADDASGDARRHEGGRSTRGASLRWTQELLMSFQQAAVAALATADRVLGAASDRKSQAKYDRDILHIIEQYPGCSEARVLDFLRARVHWFGRGTSIDSVFRPSLGTVHAAGRRLETARKINSKVDHAEHHPLLRFFPNTRIWADTECREPGLPPRLRLSDMGEGAGGRSAVRLSA